jgi:hypothetical protein
VTDQDAQHLLYLIHGVHCRAVFHPERPRRQRHALSVSDGSFGGIANMKEIACGKDWESAFAAMWKAKHA